MKKIALLFLTAFAFVFVFIFSAMAVTHNTAPYDKLKNRTLTISGDGVLKIMTFTVEELERMDSTTASYTYRVGKKGKTNAYTGISLTHLLNLAGLKSTAQAVRFTSSNGRILILPLDLVTKIDYVNDLDDTLLTPILAYSKDNFPLVQNEKSEGYQADVDNSEGPLHFILGQTEKKEPNSEKWFPDVKKIEVLTSMPQSRFSDMTPSFMWAEEYIDKLVDKGIMAGVTDSKFNPQGLITRGEIAEIFVKAMEIPVKGEYQELYTDVRADSPLEPYIRAATEAGILTGKGEGRFDPKGYITKNEIAVVAVRSMGLSQEVGRLVNPTISFKDADIIPKWALSFISVAEKNMLFDKNFAYDYYNGDKQVSRAETASMVYRAMILK